MAKSLQELLQLRKAARAVPTRSVPAIDWPMIVKNLNAGKVLTFKTECKFALPTNPTELAERLRKEGLTAKLRIRRPFAEVVILEPLLGFEDEEETGIAPVPAKRGPGRPPKNPLAAMGSNTSRH